MSMDIRVIATQLVHAIAHDGKSAAQLLPEAQQQVPERDRALLQELVLGTCRWYFWLETLHNRHLERPLNRKNLIAASLLKIGLYQLLFLRIPAHAALNETVAATPALGISTLTGLVNAVLRKVQEEQAELVPDDTQSYPDWLREKLKHNWPEHWQDILVQGNVHPPMTLRVNLQKTDRAAYLAQLAAVGIGALPCPISATGITLSASCPVQSLPGFADGHVSVQDEAGQLCITLLEIESGQRVLDACAAPGGKTCALLEQHPDIDLTALDIDAQRVGRISENLARLQLHCAVRQGDMSTPAEWWDGQPFDRILLDAPCSATGVIRRHPDIKLLRQAEDIRHLADTQLDLLRSAWYCLAPGGKLLYATCSILPQENSRVIERFLQQEASAKLDSIDAPWGLDTGFGRQLFPVAQGHDGFFYSRLVKPA